MNDFKVFAGIQPTKCPSQLQPFFFMARMVQASQIGRIEGPDGPLFSRDSGTQRNSSRYTGRVNFLQPKESSFGQSGVSLCLQHHRADGIAPVDLGLEQDRLIDQDRPARDDGGE